MHTRLVQTKLNMKDFVSATVAVYYKHGDMGLAAVSGIRIDISQMQLIKKIFKKTVNNWTNYNETKMV